MSGKLNRFILLYSGTMELFVAALVCTCSGDSGRG